MNTSLKSEIRQALEQIEEWFFLHEQGKPAPLSSHTLKNIHEELSWMLLYMNPKRYYPAYPRFLTDSYPANRTEQDMQIIDMLVDLSHSYRNIK